MHLPNGTKCCLPSPPCGEVVCEVVASLEACNRFAQMHPPWCPDPSHCRRLRVDDSISARIPTWESVIAPFVYVPSASLCGMVVLWSVLGQVYVYLMKFHQFKRMVTNYIGCFDSPIPRNPNFMKTITMMQIIASMWAVCVFVVKCYELSTPPVVRWMDGILGVFHTLHYFTIGLKFEFRMHILLTSWQLVDVVTVPNMLVRFFLDDSSKHWLTLEFLRSIQVLNSYERLDQLGALKLGLGEVAHEVLLMTFRFCALVVCFASSIFALEVLGELPFGQETLLSTAMGDISFFTMLYWVVETISTVGYGDFAPKTFLSRLTTMTYMIAGVAFFTLELQRIFTISRRQKKGAGEYQKTSRNHVVLLGGGVRHIDSALILAFLDELYHTSYRNSWPDLVIMSMTQSIEKLREDVELHLDRGAQQNITYLVGSPLRLHDLKRCRCDVAVLVLIVADTTGRLEPLQEDKMNILRTLSLKTGFPRTPLRLMLLLSESKQKALSVGIRDQRCFSLNDLRSGLLWTSSRCIGWNTMFSNIIVTTEPGELSESELEMTPWLADYMSGMDHEMYGFLAAEEFHGKTLQRFIEAAYCQFEVCVFAAQIEGRITLAPLRCQELVNENMVFFALAPAEENLNDVVTTSKQHHWKEVFARNRWRVYEEEDSRRRTQWSGHRDSVLTQIPSGIASRHSLESIDSTYAFSIAGHGEVPDNPATTGREGTNESNNSNCGPPELRPLLGTDSIKTTQSKKSISDGAIPHSRSKTKLLAGLDDLLREEEKTREEIREEENRLLFDGEALDFEDIIALDKRVQTIRRNTKVAPFILLLDLSGSWQQVIPFIMRNRTKSLPFIMPIVVLSPVAPSRSITDRLGLMKDTNLGVTVGNPVWAQDLLRSGVQECCVIVCLGLSADQALDDSGTDGTEMLDADVVMLQRMLDLLGQENRHTLLEFKRAQNMRLLPVLKNDEPTQWRLAQAAEDAEIDFDHTAPSLGYSILRKMKTGLMQKKSLQDQDYCLDPRFASGQIFTPHVLGAMIACEYRMPGIIEMTQMLVTPAPEAEPGERSLNFLWQIRVKKQHLNLTYGKMFSEMVNDAENPALPLGIMRRFDDTSHRGYVWTNPNASVRLQKTDLIYLLADSAFGKAAYEQGLIPFSGKEVPSPRDGSTTPSRFASRPQHRGGTNSSEASPKNAPPSGSPEPSGSKGFGLEQTRGSYTKLAVVQESPS